MLDPKAKEQLVLEIIATAEVVGSTMTPVAALMFADDIEPYGAVVASRALARCRRELSGRLTLAAVLERIEDGHLLPNEAWAVAITAADEAATVVWSEEAAQAWANSARALVAAGDRVAARMAFIETYQRLVREAKAQRRPAAYAMSLGHDASSRDGVLRAAVAAGQLPPGMVEPYLLPTGQPLALPAPLRELVGQLAIGREVPDV